MSGALLWHLLGASKVTLKSVLIAVCIICIIYPTTTVLSAASSAKALQSSYDNHHGYRKINQDVDTALLKSEHTLGSQGRMLVELVARDAESTTNTEIQMLGEGEHGQETAKNRQDPQFSKRIALSGPEISTRNSQASRRGSSGRKPRAKKDLPRKIPCHRCPSSQGPFYDSGPSDVLLSRQFGDRYREPHKPLQHKISTERDDGADKKRDTGLVMAANAMRLQITSHEAVTKNTTILDVHPSLNNATILPNNGTNNGTSIDPRDDSKTSMIYFLYVILVVVGFCMFLLFVVMLRHACIHRKRKGSINSRRKEYPVGGSQQMDDLPVDNSLQNPTRGSKDRNRMNRIDEDVAQEAPIAQNDGVGDGIRWLLPWRETRKPGHTPPLGRTPSYRIETLRLPQPTLTTVRKFSGLPSEASVSENL